ncbi:MAG: hypothetical protein QM654_15275 [Dysgonamonadaceae bacterium]
MPKTAELPKHPQDFIAYEEARRHKTGMIPSRVTYKEVKAAMNKINPDEESMKSRG